MRRRPALILACTLAWAGCDDAARPEPPVPAPLAERQFALDAGADAPPNSPPVAADDAIAVDEDGSVTFDVLTNDIDDDGDALTVFVSDNTNEGTLTSLGDGSYEYAPRPNFNGTDSFTYGVLDGNGGSDEAVVTITVAPVNDPPTLVSPTPADGALLSVVLGSEIEVPIVGADIDGDALAPGFDLVGGATMPVLDGTSLRWLPTAADLGSHTLRIFVSDGSEETSRTLTLTVTPPGDSPCGETVCVGGTVCWGTQCFPPCVTNTDCDGETSCFDGHCAATACNGQACEGDEGCTLGGCFRECSFDGECRPGQRCWGSRCAETSCADIVCPSGSTCFGGTCRTDCESDADCAEGMCFDGGCAAEPCDGVICPAGQVCEEGACAPEPDGPAADEPRFESGGCGCTTVTGSPTSLLLLIVVLLGLRRAYRHV